MFVLEVFKSFESCVVFLLPDQVVGLIDCLQHCQGIPERIASFGQVLSHSPCVDQCLLLCRQLLCACLYRLVEGQDLGCKGRRSLSDLLELADGLQELLVFRKPYCFDFCLFFICIVGQAFYEVLRSPGIRSILESWN